MDTRDSAVVPKKRGPPAGRRMCWAVTVNAKGDEELEPMAKFDDISLFHMAVVRHRGEEKQREHWHYFLHFKTAVSKEAVKLFLKCNHAHCEAVKSTSGYLKYINDGHCTIEGPFEFGRPVGKGHRTDFERLVSQAKKGWTRAQIYEYQPSMLRYTVSVNTAMDEFSPLPRITSRHITVIFFWGPKDSGKTVRACRQFPYAFYVLGRYVEGKTFDGYSHQDTLILDEWKDDEWDLTFMNGVCGEVEMTVIARYHNKKAVWTRVIICSNQDPAQLYMGDPTFQRRITHRIYVDKREDKGGPMIDLSI